MKPRFDPSRRRWVGATLAAGALAPWARLSFAASRPADAGHRVVMVILRGGLDGLSAAPAIGDPAFAEARGVLGQFASPALPLDTTFALHPNLVRLHGLYGNGELAVIHAVGLAYRDRSHFDAQQVLESGGTRPHELTTGWLGRALGVDKAKGLALDTVVPLTLRGRAPIDTWAPSTLPEPNADLVARLEHLYADDPQLATALDRAKALHVVDGPAMADAATNAKARGGGFTLLAQRAAAFLAEPGGPQAAVLEMSGWDTHANQANPNGALANLLRQFDSGLGALRDDLVASDTWARTVVVVATEFGREVAVNGTLGTDHGTGGTAFVLGGAVAGGRVIADWPGLAKANRFEGRDLRTTTDLRAVLKGALADSFRLSDRALTREVFPGSEAIKALRLVRA